jgi:hypothetical protein
VNSDWINLGRKWIPRSARQWIQQFVSLDNLKSTWRAQQDPLSQVTSGISQSGKHGIKLGIFWNRAQFHLAYVRACQELDLSFQVIDLYADNWCRLVEQAKCNAFLAWPDATQRPMASLFKDRCDLVERELGIPVFPNFLERWLYEDKVRQRDWLISTNLPHPRTWVFTNKTEALQFASTAALPIVLKTGFGSAATGVRILRKRKALIAAIKSAFGAGLVAGGHDFRDREWGRVFLQEFLPIQREWRMVRIGESYFGHPKGRVGDFHSGSGLAEWDVPGPELLDFLHHVTETGKFRSMDVDIFELRNGKLLINELQTVFGASVSVDQLRNNGERGRMVRSSSGQWHFEAGDFARNACANERIRFLLNCLATPASLSNCE